MLVGAAMMGVLGDGKGIECVRCRNRPSGDEDCELCGGQGRLHEEFDSDDPPFDVRPYREMLRFFLWYPQRPPTPQEWFEQPWILSHCFELISPFLFGEFEDRRDAKTND